MGRKRKGPKRARPVRVQPPEQPRRPPVTVLTPFGTAGAPAGSVSTEINEPRED